MLPLDKDNPLAAYWLGLDSSSTITPSSSSASFWDTEFWRLLHALYQDRLSFLFVFVNMFVDSFYLGVMWLRFVLAPSRIPVPKVPITRRALFSARVHLLLFYMLVQCYTVYLAWWCAPKYEHLFESWYVLKTLLQAMLMLDQMPYYAVVGSFAAIWPGLMTMLGNAAVMIGIIGSCLCLACLLCSKRSKWITTNSVPSWFEPLRSWTFLGLMGLLFMHDILGVTGRIALQSVSSLCEPITTSKSLNSEDGYEMAFGFTANQLLSIARYCSQNHDATLVKALSYLGLISPSGIIENQFVRVDREQDTVLFKKSAVTFHQRSRLRPFMSALMNDQFTYSLNNPSNHRHICNTLDNTVGPFATVIESRLKCHEWGQWAEIYAKRVCNNFSDDLLAPWVLSHQLSSAVTIISMVLLFLF